MVWINLSTKHVLGLVIGSWTSDTAKIVKSSCVNSNSDLKILNSVVSTSFLFLLLPKAEIWISRRHIQQIEEHFKSSQVVYEEAEELFLLRALIVHVSFIYFIAEAFYFYSSKKYIFIN